MPALAIKTQDKRHTHPPVVKLFFLEFSPHFPLIHSDTWSPEGKPSILIQVMQVYGASIVKTAHVSSFIVSTLATARDQILEASYPELHDNIYLIATLGVRSSIRESSPETLSYPCLCVAPAFRNVSPKSIPSSASCNIFKKI